MNRAMVGIPAMALFCVMGTYSCHSCPDTLRNEILGGN